MRNYTIQKKQVVQEEEILENVICNMCGSKQDPHVGNCTDITINFGYGSKYDGDKWEFDLCDDCLDNIKNQMKIHPTIKSMF
jgi:hypothetical protein